MAAITVRNLSDATHRALKARAASAGRSTEAEVRAILDEAVADEDGVRLGSLLAGIGRAAGGVDLVFERDRTPHEPLGLE
ncbi:FitA-like ribbon-helix-helix domain-containing protein [Mariniluteicoccus flavus]